MAKVRPTERSLPSWTVDPAAAARPPVAPSVLGQAVSSADGRFHFVSFLTTPLLRGSRNDYVVFDTAPAEAEKDHAYVWEVRDEDQNVVEGGTEGVGVFAWSPAALGEYVVKVAVRVDGVEVAALSMRQTVMDVHAGDLAEATRMELDALAAEGAGAPAGGDRAAIVGDLDATTELLLELSVYANEAALVTQAEVVNGQRNRGVPAPFLAAIVYEGILTQPKVWSIWRFWMLGPGLRTTELEWAAEEVNDPASIQLSREIDNALGVAKIRMDTAAMVLGGIAWRDLDHDPAKRQKDRDAIWEAFKQAFGDPTKPTGPTPDDMAAYRRRVDLFNLLRFPRTNLIVAAKLLARLKNRRFPALSQQQFLAGERARQIVATEYQIGSVQIPPGTNPADAVPNAYGRRVAGLATRPFVATWFKTEDDVTPPYSDLDLARAGPSPVAEVTALQEDLRDLGFRLAVDEGTGAADGGFGNLTELAVREFQIHAKFDFSAYDRAGRPGATAYSDWLRSTVNFARYGGPVSGVVDRETRRRIQLWKARRWRCPVVIDARDVAGNELRDAAGNVIHSNIWAFDFAPPAGGNWRAHARDLSRYYTFPGGRDPVARTRLGRREVSGGLIGPGSIIGTPTSLGGWSLPTSEVWFPDSEVLPEHLLGPGKTLDALSAAERATYKAVRSVAEIECNGYFDSMNAWDPAFLSLGTCHWTIAILLGGTFEDGELVAYLAYLRYTDRGAFDRAIAPFGIRPADRWGDAASDPHAGGAPFLKSLRKYAGWLIRQNASGDWVNMPRTQEAGDWFRNWHWYYRFAMAGRTIEGFRRRMWHMARMRLRDILSIPWNPPSNPPAIANPSPIPNLADGRAPTMGDVFTSEKAVALLLRMHVLAPARVVESRWEATLVPPRRSYWASTTLRTIVANAIPAPIPGPDTKEWGDNDNEHLILTAFMSWVNGTTPPPSPSAELQRTLRIVDQFPFQPGRNSLQFQLTRTASSAVVDAPGDALVGVLSSTRDSFRSHFETSGLPTQADWAAVR